MFSLPQNFYPGSVQQGTGICLEAAKDKGTATPIAALIHQVQRVTHAGVKYWLSWGPAKKLAARHMAVLEGQKKHNPYSQS